ncbi:MAG TPA: hypothetical protein PKY99_11200 [Turneriella sp.]|nr:hypothetical protein [Turneriella sp.]
MLHPYTALVWGMGASLLCFYAAFFNRKRNKLRHRQLAGLGILLNLISSVYLIYAVRAVGVEMPSEYSLPVITAHRIFATLLALAMLAMAASGIRRRVEFHRRLSWFFLPGYTLTYFSGMVIFHG